MTDQELHTLEVELDEYGTISKADALRLIAEMRQLKETAALLSLAHGALYSTQYDSFIVPAESGLSDD